MFSHILHPNTFPILDSQPPSIGVLCTLYCLLQGSLTILDWMREHPHLTAQIDIRRFIAFGVIHRILLRIHCYPYLYQEKGGLAGEDSIGQSNPINLSGMIAENGGVAVGGINIPGGGTGSNANNIPNQIARLLDGTHHLDDLGTRFHLDKKQLLEALADKANFIWK